MKSINLKKWADCKIANESFLRVFNDRLLNSKIDIDLESDVWNVLPWCLRIDNARSKNANFKAIQNDDLKSLCKVWVIDALLSGRYKSLASVNLSIVAFKVLSQVLNSRALYTLKTDDFYEAEKVLSKRYKRFIHVTSVLQQISRWLSLNFRIRLDYIRSKVTSVHHGRLGNEDGRYNKLVPTEVIRDLIAARHKTDLSTQDTLFISAFAIMLATGFRVGELASLPANCMLKLNGKLNILHFPEKGGPSSPRVIHASLSELVEDAINIILKLTDEPRKLARKLSEIQGFDWPRITNDDVAFRYFIAKIAHEWTTDPDHKVISPNGAWFDKEKRFIDVVGTYNGLGLTKKETAEKLGLTLGQFYKLFSQQLASIDNTTSILIVGGNSHGQIKKTWNKDRRLISFKKIQKLIRINLNQSRRKLIIDILEAAQVCQLSGRIYPMPEENIRLEKEFSLGRKPVLKSSSGEVMLFQDQALFLIHKNSIANSRKVNFSEFVYLSKEYFSRWLKGSKRYNYEDSVTSRLNIYDPRTGTIAKFTSHDIRHWLNTIYQNGGLSQDQIALVFNRKFNKQNATYDQTSMVVRTDRLRQQLREKLIIGDVAEAYHRIADYSREEAEDYLLAATRMFNPMPHGVCMLSWATTPCPHHLSCFSCDDEKPCEHLVIDPDNQETTAELTRMQRESQILIEAIESQGVTDSPTLDHSKRIYRNISAVIDRVNNVHYRT